MRWLWWSLTVIGVGLISIVLSQRQALDPLENLSLRITSPIEGGLRDVAQPIADFFTGVFDRGDLVQENRRLRAEIEELRAELARYQDAERRYEELLGLLEVKQGRPEDTLVVANVIAQDPSPLKRAIVIDRGASDGVEEGMVVLAQGGSLVGTVSRAYADFSWVTLITDPDSVVNAQVQGVDVRGVVRGDLRRELLLEMVPSTTPLEPGLLVTTSGLGGNYPPTLLMGTIEAVENKAQALFQTATLAPAFDLSQLETVLVLSSFVPARRIGP